MDRRIKTALQLIHLEGRIGDLPISQLARRVNLSPWHFIRLFKAETSLSPKQYMRRLQMNHAEQLLSDSLLSVKEIVARVGLKDQSHFSRDFKKLFGKPPSDFRSDK